MSFPSLNPACTRTGFTLVEMLVTLGLLSVLVLISVSWMTTIVSAQARRQSDARWQRASLMLLEQIQRDLIQLDAIDESRRRDQPRVWVEREALLIRTPDAGRLSTLRYEFNPQMNTLSRSQLDDADDRGPMVPLIGDVRQFAIELRLPDEQRARPSLHLTIESKSGRSQAGVFVLELEDVRR